MIRHSVPKLWFSTAFSNQLVIAELATGGVMFRTHAVCNPLVNALHFGLQAHIVAQLSKTSKGGHDALARSAFSRKPTLEEHSVFDSLLARDVALSCMPVGK